jgi:hypothetical protein
MIKFEVFLIYFFIQDIGIAISGMKPVLFTTIRQKLKAYKTFDIINPASLLSGADFCYKSARLTALKTV